jgi:hypothetical protein
MPKVGNPEFPARDISEEGDGSRLLTRIELVWRAVRQWAEANGHQWEPSFGVVGVAAA